MLKNILKSAVGATLVEMVLSIMLLSLVGVVVFPQWDISGPQVYSASIKVAKDIRYAQHRAMVTGQAHGFRTTSANSYEIYQVDSNQPITDPLSGGNFVVNLGNAFNDVAFQAPQHIEFNYIGSPTTGGGSVVVLVSGVEEKTFVVQNDTGHVVATF